MSGYVASDGSPLALYLAVPPGDEPAIIHSALEPTSSILELGSGPGRITRVLLAPGHTVVAVDDSSEMLDHVTGAEQSVRTRSISTCDAGSTVCWPAAI